MKIGVLFVMMLASGFLATAQMDHHFGPLDPRPPRIPEEKTFSSSSIAGYIKEHYHEEKERVRVAYNWVAANIRYDRDSMLSINWSKNNADKIAATLRRKKGVCDNFASVFTDILLKMNIPSFVVNGLAKGDGKDLAHSWSAVQLANEWYLCDPTWDAGFSNKGRYFLIAPAEFIASHWPFDPLWQLLKKPYSLPEFEKGFSAGNKKEVFPNLADSVKQFLLLDSLQQLEATSARMRAIGLEQKSLQTWYAYNNMNIAIIYGEQDMNLYNAAVADLNKANTYLNEFINYRNNFFKPIRDDQAIRNMLQPITGLINAAMQKMEAIGKLRENFQYDTGFLKERLKTMNSKLEQQNNFLNRYMQSSVADRETIFYN
ncbi:MAG: hypothetical protein H7X88_08240 [Gloeobacteraceae cyanobacterium ES-bin-316]|nr:hypothetical protein [Ferruginibacter sp.]